MPEHKINNDICSSDPMFEQFRSHIEAMPKSISQEQQQIADLKAKVREQARVIEKIKSWRASDDAWFEIHEFLEERDKAKEATT